MAWTKVGASQAPTGASITTQTAIRVPGAVGNLIIVALIQTVTTNAATISDTQGHLWTDVNPDLNDAGTTCRLHSWYAIAKNTSSTTITGASNSAAGTIEMSVDEFSGNSATPLDQVAHSPVSTSGTPISPAIVPTANDCLIWAMANDSATVGAIDGTTATLAASDGGGDITEYRFLSGRSGISMTAAFVGSGFYDVFVASFKPLVAAALPQRGRPFPFKPGSPPSTSSPFR